jgi:hypothetical protein
MIPYVLNNKYPKDQLRCINIDGGVLNSFDNPRPSQARGGGVGFARAWERGYDFAWDTPKNPSYYSRHFKVCFIDDSQPIISSICQGGP